MVLVCGGMLAPRQVCGVGAVRHANKCRASVCVALGWVPWAERGGAWVPVFPATRDEAEACSGAKFVTRANVIRAG